MKKTEEEKIRANEIYFSNLINILGEGGMFGWKSEGEVLVKRNGKLVCPKKSYHKAMNIVSESFFENNFELKTN